MGEYRPGPKIDEETILKTKKTLKLIELQRRKISDLEDEKKEKQEGGKLVSMGIVCFPLIIVSILREFIEISISIGLLMAFGSMVPLALFFSASIRKLDKEIKEAEQEIGNLRNLIN